MKLELVVIFLVTLCCSVLTERKFQCSKHTALIQNKRAAYEFSLKLLRRVTEDTYSHFVFSPLSTWMQLITLSEGARGSTFREIWNVTQHRRNKCFKRKLGEIMFTLKRDLRNENKRKIVIAIDRLLAVKKSFVQRVQRLYGVQVLLLDFENPQQSANEVNNAIDESTGGAIDQILYYDDFISTMLLMSDANYFRSAWQTQFNSGNTKTEPFYSSENPDIKIGDVSMMNRIGYFHLVNFSRIGATVLELPFAKNSITMLIFLPRSNLWVGEIFYSLQNTRLTSIFNLFRSEGLKPVNVSIPKFKQRTEIDSLPELLYDMGVKRIFDPDLAEFNGISDYKLYASLMTQISQIEVNEEEVTVGVENIIASNYSSPIEFHVNRPFAYMIVDRRSEFILYAGVYSEPKVF